MMKLSKILSVIFLTCVFCSCEKALDKRDLAAVGEQDNVWGDLDLATAYVNRIYMNNLPEWSNDISDYSEESDGGGSYMYGQLTENSVDYWPYDMVRDINILLKEVSNGTLSDANKKLLKGQAFFFRGWQYFEMVKRYGGVPLILEPQKLSDDLYVKRNKTSECIQQIVKDLDSAITYLPEIRAESSDNNGRLHKGTALAVKGRVLLYYASEQFDPNQTATGRWQAAYDANKAAKEYLDQKGFGLFASFTDLWFTEMNKEAIFVRRYQYFPEIDKSSSNWSGATRPLDVSVNASGANKPTLEIMAAFPMKDGKAINDASSAYTYDPLYFWKNRDPRFNQTFVHNGDRWEVGGNGRVSGRIQWTYVGGEQNNPTNTGYYIRKAVDENQNAIQARYSSTDWIELRYAEVLLNYAEAANEIGKTDEAYTSLIAIRKRAGIDPGSNSLYGLAAGMTKAQMRTAIMNERKVELAFEAKRYWDLRRRRLFESQLNGTRRHGHTITLKVPAAQWNTLRNSSTTEEMLNIVNQQYGTYFNPQIKLLDTQFDINWKPNYYFFAIPTKHIELNSNLEQTAGWAGGTFDPLQ